MQPVNNDGRSQSLIDILGDSTSRQILAALNVQRQSVKEIAEHLNLSQPTVYRRINDLEEHNLIEKHTIVGPDGAHYNLYECEFVSAIVHLRGTNYEVEIIRESSNSNIIMELMKEIRRLID